ncbi:hypothetical protein AWB70_05037 [Caballeronia cordobensis]|uniref:Uncharacterized protein n=1 Tax=Caballeronia cordobensis TaxID=1353886 RepID=A0A158ILB8_CABCO|nr:hypothetical protein AWB70_05037 [Caballeronia cordobensis]
MKLFATVCVWLFATANPVLVTHANAAAPLKSYGEMSFSVFSPCAGNASFCAPTILAHGIAKADTAESLRSFVTNIANRLT